MREVVAGCAIRVMIAMLPVSMAHVELTRSSEISGRIFHNQIRSTG